jgi:hypothetical protein
MSTTPSEPETPDIDELVAYLDGELSAEDARLVERRLANDADYRQKLTELEQAWSALDALPQTAAGENFARTTIEMVAVAAEKDLSTTKVEVEATEARRKWLTVAAGVAIAVAAFAAGRLLVPTHDDALVATLPVVAQLDVLTQVGSIDYLQGLSELEIQPDPRHEEAAEAWSAVSELRSPEERRAWIEGLSQEKKAELAARFERFNRLQPAEKDRLFALDRAIDESTGHKELEATLATYASWIQSRTQGEQLELRDRDVSTAERLKRAEQLVQRSNRAAQRPLSLEDEHALQEAILEIVDKRRPEFLRSIGGEGNGDAERRVSSMSAGRVALAIIGRDLWNDDRRRQLQDQLVSRLSPEAQEYFDQLDNRRKGRQLWQWTFQALEPSLRPQSLEDFFAKDLTNDQREYLLGLPYSEMEEQLQQLYMASQVGFRNDDWQPRGERRGREDWERGRGPGERRRDGRRDGDGGPRFEGRPFGPGGPNGPPPPGGPGRPPRDGRGFAPPPGGPRGEFGPPMGPPPQGPPRDDSDHEREEPS